MTHHRGARPLRKLVYVLVAAGLLASVLPAQPAAAADFTPSCGDGGALTSAIATASSNGQDDTVSLAAGCTYGTAGTLTFGNDGAGNTTTIEGNGATLSGDQSFFGHRVVTVQAGAEVVLDAVRITNGLEEGGAGINNAGTVTVTDSLIDDNGGGGGLGGGILNTGTLTVINTTVTNNQAFRGSGIRSEAGTVTITNATVADNLPAGSGGAGIQNVGSSTMTVKNTIVADNQGENCGGTIIDAGNNLEFGGPTDVGQNPSCPFPNADPGRSSLQFNGGPTKTFAISSGGAAVDEGTSSGAPATDQRGATRDATPDIGAYEIAPYTYAPTRGDDPAPDGCQLTDCSLREAVLASNSNGGDDTIDIPADTYQLSRTGVDEDAASTGDLDLTADVTITGESSATTVIDGGDIDRIFDVRPGVSTTISDVQVTNGYVVAHSSPDRGQGGGINNEGSLTLNSVEVANNDNEGTGGELVSDGGGIHNEGTLNVNDSKIMQNRALASSGGGGIGSSGGTVNILRSTIDGNTTGEHAAGISANGTTLSIIESTVSRNAANQQYGAIFSANGGTFTMKNSTVSSNTSGSGNGEAVIVSTNPMTWNNVTVAYNQNLDNVGASAVRNLAGSGHSNKNTHIANNTGGNGTQCSAAMTSSGATNLESATGCFTASDFQNASPSLSTPLANNGGPTETHDVFSTPPKDSGTSCEATDQRGVTRPQNGTCDIGAAEYDETPPDTEISSGPDDPTNSTSATFEFASDDTDPHGTFECSLDDITYDPCESPKTYTGLSEGPNTFYVAAKDLSTNTDPTPATYTWTIDLTPPGDPSITDSTPGSPANNNNPTIDGTADDGSQVQLYSDDTCTTAVSGANETATGGEFSIPVAVNDDSSNTYYATAADAVGNESGCSAGFTYEEDSTGPTLTIDGGPSGDTSDNQPTFTFSYSGHVGSPECSIVASGSPTYGACTTATSHTPAAPLSNGSYTFYVKIADAIGNDTERTRTFTVDTAPPATPSVSGTLPSSPGNDTTPRVDGTAESSVSIEVFTGTCGTSLGTTVTDGSGDWSYVLTAGQALADGSTTQFSAKAFDAASNYSGCSNVVSYVTDTSAPGTPSITGSTPSSPANNNDPNINGTAETGATVELFSDSTCTTSTGATATASGGTFSIDPPDVSDDTSTDYYAKATDPATNASGCSSVFTYVEDSTDPTVSITGGPSGTTNDNTPTFDFSSSDGGTTFECSIDQGTEAFDDCSSSSSHTPSSALADESYTFRVRATDDAGNLGTADTQTFTVDATAPSVQIDSGPQDPTPTNDSTPTFTFSGEGGATFECSLDTGVASYGACSAPGEHTPASALPDGQRTFRVKASDGAGNSAEVTRMFTVDTTPPDTNIVTKPKAKTKKRKATFTFTATEPNATFTCTLDGVAVACAGGTYTTPRLKPRRHTFTVAATDAAGNTDPVPATYTWKVLRT